MQNKSWNTRFIHKRNAEDLQTLQLGINASTNLAEKIGPKSKLIGLKEMLLKQRCMQLSKFARERERERSKEGDQLSVLPTTFITKFKRTLCSTSNTVGRVDHK